MRAICKEGNFVGLVCGCVLAVGVACLNLVRPVLDGAVGPGRAADLGVVHEIRSGGAGVVTGCLIGEHAETGGLESSRSELTGCTGLGHCVA